MTIFRCEGLLKKIAVIPLSLALMGCSSERSSENNEDSQAVNDTTGPNVNVRYDIPSLIGSSKSEIDALWGKPNCPAKNACIYGDVKEVYYVNGRAANFTLPPADDMRVYGFSVAAPSFTNTDVKRWDVDLDSGTAEISSFKNFYVYVKTQEP